MQASNPKLTSLLWTSKFAEFSIFICLSHMSTLIISSICLSNSIKFNSISFPILSNKSPVSILSSLLKYLESKIILNLSVSKIIYPSDG